MLPTIKTVFWIPVYTCWAAISGNNLWHDNYVQMNYDKRPKNESRSQSEVWCREAILFSRRAKKSSQFSFIRKIHGPRFLFL